MDCARHGAHKPRNSRYYVLQEACFGSGVILFFEMAVILCQLKLKTSSAQLAPLFFWFTTQVCDLGATFFHIADFRKIKTAQNQQTAKAVYVPLARPPLNSIDMK